MCCSLAESIASAGCCRLFPCPSGDQSGWATGVFMLIAWAMMAAGAAPAAAAQWHLIWSQSRSSAKCPLQEVIKLQCGNYAWFMSSRSHTHTSLVPAAAIQPQTRSDPWAHLQTRPHLLLLLLLLQCSPGLCCVLPPADWELYSF